MPHLSGDTSPAAAPAGRNDPRKPLNPAGGAGPCVRPVGRPADTACYSIAADDDPGMLPRLMAPIAKRGTVPARMHAVREESRLMVDIQVCGLDSDTARLVAETFRTVVGVHSVLFAERVAAEGRQGASAFDGTIRKAG